MKFLRQNAIGLIALAVALSGTAYAANKVGPRDIVRNAVRSQHIAPNQVRPGDLNRRVRVALRRPGPRGPKGAQGPKGDTGPEGNFGNIQIVNGPAVTIGAFGSGNEVQGAEAVCPGDAKVISGGWIGSGINSIIGYNATSGNSWGVIAINYEDEAVTDFRAQAICAS